LSDHFSAPEQGEQMFISVRSFRYALVSSGETAQLVVYGVV
jgi:hypothetical protein